MKFKQHFLLCTKHAYTITSFSDVNWKETVAPFGAIKYSFSLSKQKRKKRKAAMYENLRCPSVFCLLAQRNYKTHVSFSLLLPTPDCYTICNLLQTKKKRRRERERSDSANMRCKQPSESAAHVWKVAFTINKCRLRVTSVPLYCRCIGRRPPRCFWVGSMHVCRACGHKNKKKTALFAAAVIKSRHLGFRSFFFSKVKASWVLSFCKAMTSILETFLT